MLQGAKSVKHSSYHLWSVSGKLSSQCALTLSLYRWRFWKRFIPVVLLHWKLLCSYWQKRCGVKSSSNSRLVWYEWTPGAASTRWIVIMGGSVCFIFFVPVLRRRFGHLVSLFPPVLGRDCLHSDVEWSTSTSDRAEACYVMLHLSESSLLVFHCRSQCFRAFNLLHPSSVVSCLTKTKAVSDLCFQLLVTYWRLELWRWPWILWRLQEQHT